MNRVQANLAATLLPVHFGAETEPAPWAGLVDILSGAITGYTAIRQTEEQRKAAEVMADIERMKLSQASQARVSDFLRRYWPHLAIGIGGLVTLGVLFRKRS